MYKKKQVAGTRRLCDATNYNNSNVRSKSQRHTYFEIQCPMAVQVM